jgi:porin
MITKDRGGRPTIAGNLIDDCFPADSQGGADWRWIVPEGGDELGLLRICYWGVWFSWLIFPALGLSQASETSSRGDESGWTEAIGVYPELSERLDSRGVGLHGSFDYDWSKELPGDADDTGWGRYSFDLSLGVDGEKGFGGKGFSGLLRLKHHVNHFGEDDAGPAQGFSNIDAPSRTTLYEAWLEQRLLSDRLRIKGGKIDANSEFAAVATAADFLNSSMGFSPTIVGFPSYPLPKPGINVFLRPNASYGLGVGIFQTDGMGTMSVIEPGVRWLAGDTERSGQISVGYWRLDGTLQRFDGLRAQAAQGFYGVAEQSGWRHPWRGEEGERRLSTFLQIGSAGNQISAITRHIGGGAVMRHPFQHRRDDSVGAAATWVHFSSAAQAGFGWTGEWVAEAYYKATLSSHVSIVQDFQFVHHPGGRKEQGDEAFITPRLLFSF